MSTHVTVSASSTLVSTRDGCAVADDSDIDQILALNLAEYGAGAERPSTDVVGTRAEYHWRCREGPAGPAVVPVVRDAEGAVSGFIWLIPLAVRVGRRNRKAATGVNLVIRADRRGSFEAVKLLRRFNQALREGGFALHFSFVAEEVQRRLQAEDPDSTLAVPLLVKPLDIAGLARAYGARRWQRIIARMCGPVASLLFLRRGPRAGAGVEVETLQAFDQRFDTFWQRVADKYEAAVIRDSAFLAWRFSPVGHRRYETLVAHANGDMLGYAVTRCARIRGVDTGVILDLLVVDGPRGLDAGLQLVAEAEARFRHRAMSMMVSLMAKRAAEYGILTRSGLRSLASLNPRPFRFAFFIHGPERQDMASLRASDWFVTLADFESL